MAMHFLHKSSAGRLVSLVVLFRLGAENPALAALLPKMPAHGQPEQLLPDAPLTPRGFCLPATATTPTKARSRRPLHRGRSLACHEAAGRAFRRATARLSALFPNNARPVQPLHGRVVTEGP